MIWADRNLEHKLEVLCLRKCFSGRDEEITKKFFELNFPHLKVMFGGNIRDVMGIAVQEGKEQKSKLDLFRDVL